MNDLSVTCPKCGSTVPLTEQLAAPIIEATRQEFAAKLAAQKQEAEAGARTAVQAEIADRDRNLAALNTRLDDQTRKLAEAQAVQAAVLRERRELADAQRELALNVQKQVQTELEAVRGKARAEAEQALSLKLAEREEQLSAAQRKVEELHRRLEQGSQQLQGEALELSLEALLRERFPRDSIEPVPKGAFGGDLVQRVTGQGGQLCGTILWEAKRTRHWTDSWLPKLRGDQRAAHADMAVIVSQAVPKNLELFDHVDGIWVVQPHCAGAVAVALRQALIELAGARAAGAGQQTKAEQIYAYLTGARFRHRIEAIVEKFSSMQDDLNKERLLMQKQWTKREAQIRGVLDATVGLYGDLQGIAGNAIEDIPLLEAPN